MTNILTAAEASAALRGVSETDADLLVLLPLIDAEIKAATGRAWEEDAEIHALAKNAARILLVLRYENPGQVGASGLRTLDMGINHALAQLEAEALKYRKYQFEGLSSAGNIYLEKARQGDDIIALVGIYGAEGDQSSKFESEISDDYYIAQISSEDLSDKLYLVTLMSARDAAE